VPSDQDVNNVKLGVPAGFGNYTFVNDITKTNASRSIIMTGGNYGGLTAIRDSWEIRTFATSTATDVKVEVKRRFYSDRIPIFQFGAFYEDDLELNRPPLFTFGGRVHSNGNMWVTASGRYGIYLNSKVTAAGEIVNDIWKPGTATLAGEDDKGKVFVNDATSNPQELKTGEASVICTGTTSPNVFSSNANLPPCRKNPDWNTLKAKFQGNLESNVAPLNLPLTKINMDLINLFKRGKNIGDLENIGGTVSAVTAATQDKAVAMKERFANKTGLRVSLSDSQAKLPGCASVVSGQPCGVRLDGALGSSIGYQPLPMTDAYQTTPLNATRMEVSGRQIWIKIEMVSVGSNDTAPQTKDVTQDILSLGVTERAPIGSDLAISGYSANADSRSIIKLQRFSIPGPNIPDSGTTSYTTNYTLNGVSQNLVVRYKDVLSDPSSGCLLSVPACNPADAFASPYPNAKAGSDATLSKEDAVHLKWANIKSSGYKYAIVPFPISIYDPREGRPNDNVSEANTAFGSTNVPAAGVMSLVDIDVANLRRFLNGDFNGTLPTTTPFAIAKGGSLRSTDVPENAGWVLFVSDRRGDYDFDGEYDMEDIFPDGILEFNEDVNHNGILERDFLNEAPQYSEAIPRGQAATSDHLYYRRGVRLINGSVVPGKYDSAVPSNTKGFTVASENGVYVKGNYNATGAAVSTTSAPTPAEDYLPHNSANHIPSAVSGDAVTILSNNWTDANSFVNPFSSSSRKATDTVVRFAMIAGDPVTGSNSNTYSPSGFGQLNGGVHNFKRMLEDWSSARLNYSGSLINLFNSRNNTGFSKCCNTVYVPPTRDWTFDSTFLDANRLPPGTPYIYSISFTGFERMTD
ncbi:MAG: hypothetical protein KDB79_03510, partial [Acidobacteria bacterium]|nr:hypothetical protein [Acidobacteriota bacterium]